MSPADLNTQRPCHVPAGDWFTEPDMRLAIQKYSLDAAPPPVVTPTPRPTATPVPQVKRVVLRRWWQPVAGERCERTLGGWCVSDTSPIAIPREGSWVQIVEIAPDGSESGPHGFTRIEP